VGTTAIIWGCEMSESVTSVGPARLPRLTAVALVVALTAGLSACESYKPKAYTADDDCRDCPPGIFSGEDGVVTLEM